MQNLYVIRLFFFLSIPLITIFLNGCQSTETQTGMQEKMKSLTYKPEEVRLLISDFAIRFTNIVEQAADRIIAETDDPKIRQNALLWKINSATAVSEVIFIPESYAALADTWTFCLQMLYFFESGNGQVLFGEQQEIAVNASRLLEQEIREIITNGMVEEKISYAEAEIIPFAEENPIENLGFTRKSTIHITAKYIAEHDRTLASSVGVIEETMSNLMMMLNVYYQQLPKIATWRAEYLANKVINDEKIDSLNANFDSITKSIERISIVTENGEVIIDNALLKTFHQIEILRLKIKEDLQNERDLLLSVLVNERELVFAEIDRERIETLEQLVDLSEELMNKASIKADDSIDHFFIRLIELLVLVYFVGLITVYIYRRKSIKEKEADKIKF